MSRSWSTPPTISTPATSRTRPSSCSPRPRHSSTSTRGDDTTRPEPCTPLRACTGSASSRSPSPSATWTRRWTLREADLEVGQEWTGWHRIEKDLWPPPSGYQTLTAQGRKDSGKQLLADTTDLYGRTRSMTFTAGQIGNGAKSLLDEVAVGKVTGEEEIWSHTDLWDFQANVVGARVAFDGLRPLLHKKDPELEVMIGQRFSSLQGLLDQRREGDGFVAYTSLEPAAVKQLSDAVNALSEPLSRLTAAVTL